MKKLMIAAAIVCAAAISQAASVSWQSGTFTDLPTCYGFTAYETTGSGEVNGCITAYVWEFATDQGFSSAADVWAEYQKGAAGKLDIANALTGTSDAFEGNADIAGANTWSDGATVYAAILYLHNQEDDAGNFTGDQDFYMANVAQGQASNLGAKVTDLGNTFGGAAAGGAATEWQPIPEPTTGLLMLLGMGALALRRRRA